MKEFLYSNPKDVPYRKVGLLLGTSKYLKGGYDNPYFVHRIEAAAELYRSGKISYILASGDNSKNWYNEPQRMKDDLVARGIAAKDIYLDYAGFRTLDSIIRAKKIFGQKALTVISQPFHNTRAVYIARHLGIDAVGFNAKDVNIKYGFKTRVREYFAKVKAYIDVHILHEQPKFLGDKIFIE